MLWSTGAGGAGGDGCAGDGVNSSGGAGGSAGELTVTAGRGGMGPLGGAGGSINVLRHVKVGAPGRGGNGKTAGKGGPLAPVVLAAASGGIAVNALGQGERKNDGTSGRVHGSPPRQAGQNGAACSAPGPALQCNGVDPHVAAPTWEVQHRVYRSDGSLRSYAFWRCITGGPILFPSQLGGCAELEIANDTAAPGVALGEPASPSWQLCTWCDSSLVYQGPPGARGPLAKRKSCSDSGAIVEPPAAFSLPYSSGIPDDPKWRQEWLCLGCAIAPIAKPCYDEKYATACCRLVGSSYVLRGLWGERHECL
jgi:hypothetical protein